MATDDCIFCQIAQGTLDTELVYQDDQVVAFNDLYPKAKTHMLIIPRQHIATLNDFDDNHQTLLGHMMLVAQKMAKKIGFDESGYRVVMNCNPDGGQEIYHAHLHLLGGQPLTWFQ